MGRSWLACTAWVRCLQRWSLLGLPMPTDTLAERLRRRPAKPMGSPRVGSNPTGVDTCRLLQQWRRFCGIPWDTAWPATHGCDTHIGPWQACTPSHPASHRQAASCHVRQLTPWPCCVPDAPAQVSQRLQPSCGSLRGAQPAPPACGKGFRAPPCLQPPSPDHRLPSAGLAAASTRVSLPLGRGGM